MIEYTIENKNGVIEHSGEFEINKTISLIRIMTSDHDISKPCKSSVKKIVKSFFINDMKMDLENNFSPMGFPPSIQDYPLSIFIKNTKELIFKLVLNSKIKIVLFT